MKSITYILALCLLLTLTSSIAVSYAQQNADDKPVAKAKPLSIDEAIVNLGDDNILLRDQATVSLMTRPDLTDDHMIQAFAQAKLPEVIQRLKRVAKHRYSKSLGPKVDEKNHQSCLGIYLPGGLGDSIVQPLKTEKQKRIGFLISKTYPGFPAHVYMQPGDLITKIDDVPFTEGFTRDDFTGKLKTYKPNEPVKFTIQRGKHTLNVVLKLDSLERLTSIYPDQGHHQLREQEMAKYLDKLMAKREFKHPVSIDLHPDTDPDD